MSSKDKELWEAYAHRVKAVVAKKTNLKSVRVNNETKVSRTMAEKPISLISALNKNLSISLHEGKTLERKREKSIRLGNIEIDAKLDLHGLTQRQAFEELAEFVHKKTKVGKRHLLVITGKGREGDGILRRNLSKWLHQLPEANAILALREAAPCHGGGGAFYVILRKNKA